MASRQTGPTWCVPQPALGLFHLAYVKDVTWSECLLSLPLLHSARVGARLQEGYGVNTFKLINAEGQENLCKFHVLPKEGGSPVLTLPTCLWAKSSPFNIQGLPYLCRRQERHAIACIPSGPSLPTLQHHTGAQASIATRCRGKVPDERGGPGSGRAEHAPQPCHARPVQQDPGRQPARVDLVRADHARVCGPRRSRLRSAG